MIYTRQHEQLIDEQESQPNSELIIQLSFPDEQTQKIQL